MKVSLFIFDDVHDRLRLDLAYFFILLTRRVEAKKKGRNKNEEKKKYTKVT